MIPVKYSSTSRTASRDLRRHFVFPRGTELRLSFIPVTSQKILLITFVSYENPFYVQHDQMASEHSKASRDNVPGKPRRTVRNASTDGRYPNIQEYM